jgi:hypothetical protein
MITSFCEKYKKIVILKTKHGAHIRLASKYLNDVILSSAKNLVFLCCYEILHFVQDDHYNCRVNNKAEVTLDYSA